MIFTHKSKNLEITIGEENRRLKYSELAKEFDHFVRSLITKSPDAFNELYDSCDRLATAKGFGKEQMLKIHQYFELQKEVEEIQKKSY